MSIDFSNAPMHTRSAKTKIDTENRKFPRLRRNTIMFLNLGHIIVAATAKFNARLLVFY